MAEVVTNHGNVDTRLEERNGTTVAQHVPRNTPLSKRRGLFRGDPYVLAQQVGSAIPGQRRSADAPEEEVLVSVGADDASQCGCRFRPQWADTLLSPFTE